MSLILLNLHMHYLDTGYNDSDIANYLLALNFIFSPVVRNSPVLVNQTC